MKKAYTLLELILILVITGFLVIGASYTYINSRSSSEDKASQVALLSFKSVIYNKLDEGSIPQNIENYVSVEGYSLTSQPSTKSSEISYYIVDSTTAILSTKTSRKCIIFKFNFVGKSGWGSSLNDCKASNFINSEIDGKESNPKVVN